MIGLILARATSKEFPCKHLVVCDDQGSSLLRHTCVFACRYSPPSVSSWVVLIYAEDRVELNRYCEQVPDIIPVYCRPRSEPGETIQEVVCEYLKRADVDCPIFILYGNVFRQDRRLLLKAEERLRDTACDSVLSVVPVEGTDSGLWQYFYTPENPAQPMAPLNIDYIKIGQRQLLPAVCKIDPGCILLSAKQTKRLRERHKADWSRMPSNWFLGKWISWVVADVPSIEVDCWNDLRKLP